MPEGEHPRAASDPCCRAASARGLPPEAIRVLTENRPRFLAALRSRLGSADLAEDVLQEGIARAIAQETPLRAERALVGWFHRILRNVIVDRARRMGAAARALERVRGDEPAFEPDDAPARPCRCVGRALEALAAPHQDVLRSVLLEGRSVADTAVVLGVTSNNCSVRLHRARAALERELRRRCGHCAADGCRDCTCRLAPPESGPIT